MTELWLRNPSDYARELAETGHNLIAWDRGHLKKKGIYDPVKFGDLHFRQGWRALLIGAQGSMEIDSEHGTNAPLAVYPTWCYDQPQAILEEMLVRPAGQNEAECFDTSIQVDERPVWGQKHRVVIAEGPPGGAGTQLGRKFYRYLHELKEDYPECEIYVHGLYSFKIMFGLGFDAVDFEPRSIAQKGRVILSSGRMTKYEDAQKNPKWLHAVGMTPADIEIPRNRCIFNIKSAIWAAQHYTELFNFRLNRNGTSVDAVTPEIDFRPDGTKHFLTVRKSPQPGDQLACDQCSLRDVCKYEREGAVCSVPNSDGSGLAKMFKTRDSEKIVEGLSTILGMQASRVENAMLDEESLGELNPEVTKMLKGLFADGVTLAKLVDPTLRSGPKVAVNVTGGGNASVAIGNPKQVVAKIVRDLEDSGIPRDQITPSMVSGVLENMAGSKAIQGTVISEHDEAANG